MNPLRTACQGLSSASDAEEFLAIDWSRPWLSCLASAGRTMAERIAKGMPVYLALNDRLPPALSDHGWHFLPQEALPAGQAYEAFLVPEDAIVPDGARKAVNVVAPDGTVTLKPVTLGPLSQGLRVIRTGVSANDKIIVNGTARMMMPGQKVKATEVKITPKPAAERTTTVTIPVASSATPAGAQ